MYVKSSKAQEYFQVSDQTLRRWAKSGQIKSIVTQGGHFRFFIPDEEESKRKIVYCRVSNRKQKEDLERQVKYMQKRYPNYEVIKDIGSGINFKRQGFLHILEELIQGNVSEVVVSTKDRFCRFNYELFEWLFQKHGAELLCHKSGKESSPEQELSEDLLSIITVFSARYHGKRKYHSESEDKN